MYGSGAGTGSWDVSLSCGISVEVMEEESKKNVGNCFPSPTLSVEVDTADILDVFFPVNLFETFCSF